MEDDTLKNEMQFSCFLTHIYCNSSTAAYTAITVFRGGLCYSISFHSSTIKKIEKEKKKNLMKKGWSCQLYSFLGNWTD